MKRASNSVELVRLGRAPAFVRGNRIFIHTGFIREIGDFHSAAFPKSSQHVT